MLVLRLQLDQNVKAATDTVLVSRKGWGEGGYKDGARESEASNRGQSGPGPHSGTSREGDSEPGCEASSRGWSGRGPAWEDQCSPRTPGGLRCPPRGVSVDNQTPAACTRSPPSADLTFRRCLLFTLHGANIYRIFSYISPWVPRDKEIYWLHFLLLNGGRFVSPD